MLTIDKLIEFGCDANEGLNRCMNNEVLYYRLINKSLEEDNYLNLKTSILNKDYDKAFEISHSLKGVLGNLSLTPLYNIVFELTEFLRNKKDMDYTNYIDNLFNKRNELLKLCE